MFYIITNTRKNKIMPLSNDNLRNLLENNTPFSRFHPDYVADPRVDRYLSLLRNISRSAFCLQKTDTYAIAIAIEEEEGIDTPTNRDVIKDVYKIALTMLNSEQILGLNCLPSFPSPAVATVSEDAYNRVHHLHFAIQTWETL